MKLSTKIIDLGHTYREKSRKHSTTTPQKLKPEGEWGFAWGNSKVNTWIFLAGPRHSKLHSQMQVPHKIFRNFNPDFLPKWIFLPYRAPPTPVQPHLPADNAAPQSMQKQGWNKVPHLQTFTRCLYYLPSLLLLQIVKLSYLSEYVTDRFGPS